MKYLQNIKHTSDILLALVSDILDITKITQGKMEPSFRELDLGELINVNAQAMAFRITEKGLSFETAIDPQLNVTVMGDPTFLNQILLNLLGNAAKFTEKGSIFLTAQCIEKTAKSIKAKISVIDTGIGIPADKVPYIFERFNQAGKATKHKYGGTGLGLSIAKQLVELHDGVISVQSILGTGTTFTYEINFELVERSISQINQASTQKNVSKLSALHILIVEDNVLNQQYIERVLMRNNLTFCTANHGKEALKFLEEQRFDLILMDIRMPEMDGYETTIRLRNMHHNPNCNVPIVALTASALLDEKEKALKTGMNYHLTKPFTPDQIEKLIAVAIDNRFEKTSHTTSSDSLYHPELNREEIELMFGGDIEHFQMILEIFNRTMPDDFGELKQAMADGNWPIAKGLAHKIKPSFQMIGLGYMTKNVQELEAALDNASDLNLIKDLFDIFLKNVQKALHITAEQESYFRQTV